MPIISGSYSPSPGQPLGRLTFLEFDATSDNFPVYATFADGTRELVWEDDEFHGRYARGSSMAFDAETDRYHFVLRRVGGWPTSQVKILLDDAGFIGQSDPYPILF